MPRYDYACSKCGETKEVTHGYQEQYTDRCEHCGGEMTRVFNVDSLGVLYKARGFYAVENRIEKRRQNGD